MIIQTQERLIGVNGYFDGFTCLLMVRCCSHGSNSYIDIGVINKNSNVCNGGDGIERH